VIYKLVSFLARPHTGAGVTIIDGEFASPLLIWRKNGAYACFASTPIQEYPELLMDRGVNRSHAVLKEKIACCTPGLIICSAAVHVVMPRGASIRCGFAA
jgi:hypothetical protein